jgi:replicative DNA helicase
LYTATDRQKPGKYAVFVLAAARAENSAMTSTLSDAAGLGGAGDKGDGGGRRRGKGGGRRPIEAAELAKLFERLPPHALEAEAALLGSMILEWRVIGDVLQIFRSEEDFYKPAHSAIYRVLVELFDKHQSLDMVQLTTRLKDLNLLDDVGGLDYLLELAESVPSAASATHYARIVRDKATMRRLIEAAGRILYDAYHSGEGAANQLDIAERMIFELAEGKSSEEAAQLKDLLQETFSRLEAHDGKSVTGVETGFFELDEMLNGMQAGEMLIVAARPSMGKTAFALNIAEHVAATNKQPVAVFSLEMSRQQLAQRLLCSRSGVDSHKLRRNMLSGDDFAKLSLTVGELSEAPLYIDDTPGLTLLQLRAKARRLAARHHVQAVFIDYLQLMSQPGAESRQQEVSNISRGIKALARELSVPVVCLSQLNRSPEGREGHRPRMSDLRESGSIEQDADVVLMLHREDYYHKGEEEYQDTNVAEVIITKQRNGPTGMVKLQFNAGSTRFNNLSAAPGPGPGSYGAPGSYGGGYGGSGNAPSSPAPRPAAAAPPPALDDVSDFPV